MKLLTGFLWIATALLLPGFSLAGAPELEWDQARVAALAQDLIEPLEALEADLESRPVVPEREAQRAALLRDVEDLHARARELARRLATGAGRAATEVEFRELQKLESQATKRTHEYPAPFDMHVHIDRVQRVTIQLARYYGTSPAEGRPHREDER